MTPTTLEKKIIALRQKCSICAQSTLESLIDLPGLPLTERYAKIPMQTMPKGIDQKFLYCSHCGHGQLAYQVNPAELYDETYFFRTSKSLKARAGTEFFLSSLRAIAGDRTFECAVDVGCNDLYLLNQLKGKAKVRIGIDPILKIESGSFDQDIITIPEMIEDVNFSAFASQPADLVVCRHTLEHIFDPRLALSKLFEWGNENTLYCFEVPGLDTLLERFRFDQIFHQHLQYFSLFSFIRLIEELGVQYQGSFLNRHDWGAFFIAFKKSAVPQKSRAQFKQWKAAEIQERFKIFRSHMDSSREILERQTGNFYGYGAGNMLPVLAYHLGSDLSFLKAVLDDNPEKDGWYYWNLPLAITRPQKVGSLKDEAIMITAVDNAYPILKKLLIEQPRDILYPLMVL